MRHPTNTRVIFAASPQEAREKYQSLKIETRDRTPVLECFKATEVEDFDASAEFNFVGEISVGPPVMEIIRQDLENAYILYSMEDITNN
jgi:hypothetical protein